MKRTLILSLSLLLAGTSFWQTTQAMSRENIVLSSIALSGPAVYGLYKLGKFIKRSKPAQTVAKGICATASALAAYALADNARALAFEKYAGVSSEKGFLFNAILSLAYGLTSCALAESTINDIKNLYQ